MALPYYYSRLKRFLDVFQAGVPILCYHHIKAPSRGARLKWLYVSPSVFTRQIAELKAEGFLTRQSFEAQTFLHKAAAQPAQSNPNRLVVLTFDDGFRDVFDNALPALRQNRLHGITFLVSDLLGKTNEWQLRMGDVEEPLMDEVQVREWLAAGQAIGSHTKTHPHLTQLSLAEAREEICASKKSLEDRFSVPVEHFCYPYGDWNKTVRDLVIEAGYRTASTVQPGINTSETNLFELNRFTAQANNLSLKARWQRLRARLTRISSIRIARPGRLASQPALR